MHILIGSTTIFLETIDSTNSYLKLKLSSNKPAEGFLIYANEQFAGRGQRTNIWESEKGKNLLLSFILYPSFLKADEQFLLSKTISLACYDFISQFTDDVSIKWPNDIYAGNKKIAGVLIENSLKGQQISNSIIGLGININQAKFSAKTPNAVSLKMRTKKTYDTGKLLAILLEKLNYWYEQLQNKKIEFIDNQYLDKLFRFNQEHFFVYNNKKTKASITGIAPDGKLIIETEKGTIESFAFKEIEYVIE